MFLTVEKTTDDVETYEECFDYLIDSLSTHALLTQTERERCVKAVGELKSVFSKFRLK